MNQRQRILQYIRDFGSITPMQAFNDLGVTRLAARISELIESGYNIKKEYVGGKNRYGEKVYFMRYSLGGD